MITQPKIHRERPSRFCFSLFANYRRRDAVRPRTPAAYRKPVRTRLTEARPDKTRGEAMNAIEIEEAISALALQLCQPRLKLHSAFTGAGEVCLPAALRRML